MAPSKGNAVNQHVVWQRLHGVEGGGGKLKLRVGDRVRISNAQEIIQERMHGYLEREVLHDSRHSPVRPARVPFDRRPERAAM